MLPKIQIFHLPFLFLVTPQKRDFERVQQKYLLESMCTLCIEQTDTRVLFIKLHPDQCKIWKADITLKICKRVSYKNLNNVSLYQLL